MTIEKILNRFSDSICFSIEQGEDMDAASWNMQEGILLSCREAQMIIDHIQKNNRDKVKKGNYCPSCGEKI